MSNNIPNIEESNKFNLFTSIWIVPFVALFIAAWLAFQYYSELGPEIKIVFPQNEGLQAGQSVIKYKDVVVGKITKIKLQNNGESVAVYARMDKSAEPYLNKNTKFWIVKPEVSFGGVSGLDTLISGTYINIYSKTHGAKQNEFVGLPYIYRADKEGEYFHLNASSGYNISRGTPILLKNIKVGEVEYVTISLDGQSVDFYIYIEKQYVPYVNVDSKFWVRSALDVDISNGKLDVDIAPISHLMQGGISFSSSGEDETQSVPSIHIFHLYKNGNIAEGQKIGKGGEYMRTYEVNVVDSIANLNVDASVRYDGYDVGRVTGIFTRYDPPTHKMTGKVRMKIDTSFFDSKNDQNITGEENFHKAVQEGLRVKITPTDPITGMLFVNLAFEENATYASIVQGGKYPVLPSVNADADPMMQIGQLIGRLNALVGSTGKIVDENAKPIHEIVANLSSTMKQINEIVSKKETKELPKSLNDTMLKLTDTLQSAQKVLKNYEEDSLMNHQLTETLKVVTEASKEMTNLLKMLNRKPDSLIFGEE